MCRRDPAAWDIDCATVEELRRSARACVYLCPLYGRCKDVVSSGAATPRSMVWAGRAYDHDGRVIDLNQAAHKVGARIGRDTRIPDSAGRVYDGHTGRWQPSTWRSAGS